jgi:pyruvate/2-oxoglutarate dehydrogenase complex dihydrolipoamide acyltransferase (E2) component
MNEPAQTRPPRSVTPLDDDASIPVLTERLTLPPLELDFTLPPAPPGAVAPAQPPNAAEAEAPASAAAPSPVTAQPPADLPWNRIDIELREAILRDLAERLPSDVEGIVRRQMSVAIDAAVQKLAAEARLALAISLREIVGRAVRAELERLRGRKE